MRAAVLFEPGTALGVEETHLAPPQAGEVLVRVEAAGCCHTDYHYMRGDLSCLLPAVLGHEGAGVVEEVGPGVSAVEPGDAVCLMWRPRCGGCRPCVAGHPNRCEKGRLQATTGGLLDGTSRLALAGGPAHHFLGVSCFAERCVVAEASVVRLPAGVPFEVAAVAGCAVVTGAGAVLNVIGACAGDSVLVLGAGGVGLSAVMAAAASGAGAILAADPNPAARRLALELGASEALDTAGDVLDAVQSLVPGGVDWAVEAVGRPATLRLALECLRSGGTAVAVGLAPAGVACEVPINELVQREKRLVGSLYGSANPPLDLPRLFALRAAGRLPFDRLVGRSYPLEQVNEAYEALLAGAVGRSILLPAA